MQYETIKAWENRLHYEKVFSYGLNWRQEFEGNSTKDLERFHKQIWLICSYYLDCLDSRDQIEFLLSILEPELEKRYEYNL